MLSALACNSSVHRIDLQYGQYLKGEARDEFWRWVAFAIFSRDAIHCVDHIQLDPRAIHSEDVEKMRQVLEADDPLAVLLGDDRDGTEKNTWISSSRFAFAAPSEDLRASVDEANDTASPFVSDFPLVVPALKKVDGGWSVLLPGYGKAWVCDEDARVVDKPMGKQLRKRLWKVGSALVPRSVRGSMGSIEATVSLFSLIGDRVDRVELNASALSGASIEGEREDWLRDILLSCPRLQELKIGSVGIGSLDVFVEPAATPRLRKLVIHGAIDVTEGTKNIEGFFDALSDQVHPLAKGLRVLDLSVHLSDDQCGAFIEMVQTAWNNSQTLQTMVVRVTPHDDAEDLVGEIEEAFFELQDQSSNQTVHHPPEEETKVAFLSVLPRFTSGEILDSGVLAKIFDFAAGERIRDFGFEI